MTTFFSPKMRLTGGLLAATVLVAGLGAAVINPSSAALQSEGTVLSVGAADITIRAMPDDETRTFQVTQEARITLDGHQVGLNHLFTGAHAKVTAVPKQTRFAATDIEARSPR